jgi:hypothetical protein
MRTFVLKLPTVFFVEIKLFARRACSFSQARSAGEKIPPAVVCVGLRLIYQNAKILTSLCKMRQKLNRIPEYSLADKRITIRNYLFSYKNPKLVHLLLSISLKSKSRGNDGFTGRLK